MSGKLFSVYNTLPQTAETNNGSTNTKPIETGTIGYYWLHHKNREGQIQSQMSSPCCICRDSKVLNSITINIRLMNRHQAATLLKELIEYTLIQPSFVSLEQRRSGNFELILQSDGDSGAIKKFVENRNLGFRIDTEKGYCIIYKPNP